MRPLGAVLVVALAWTVAALPAVESPPLRRASQARAWSVARTMARTGDLVVPRYHDEARLKKPPLQSWVQAGAMAVAGSTAYEVAGLASFGVGFLFALGPYLLGLALGRAAAGFLGSLALCASRAAEWWGTSPEHDLPFAAWTTLAFVFLARARGARARSVDPWLAGLATGAAVMVKGPFAIGFVWTTALVLRRLDRRAPREVLPRRRVALPLVALSLLPVALWLLALRARLGSVDAVFDELRRQSLGEGGAHVRSPWAYPVFYVGSLLAWSLPVSALGVPAVLWAFRRARDAFRRLSFAVVAFASTFLVLTLAPGKQDHYGLPAFPLLFLLFGAAFEAALDRFPRLARAAPAILGALAVAFAANRGYGARGLDVFVPGALGVALLAVGAAVALTWTLGARRGGASPAGPALLLAASVVGLGAGIDARRGRLVEDYADAVAPPEVRARRTFGFARGEREAFDVLAARLDLPVRRVKSADALRAALGDGVPSAVLVEEPEVGALAPLAHRLREVATFSPPKPRDPRDRVRLYAVEPER